MKQDARIIIVNSDLDQLESLTKIVGEVYHVDSYGSCADALTAMNSKRAPDLILLDVHIENPSVWAACAMFRSPDVLKLNKVPVFVTSSILSEKEFDHCFKVLSVNGFVSLHEDSSVILEKIAYLLNNYSMPVECVVLVADDNKQVTKMLDRGISVYGYSVLQAYNIGSALRIIRNKKPDVILMDHNFEGEVGFKLVETVRKERVEAVIIVVTGNQSAELALEYSRWGVDAFANKPFDAGYISHLINDALHRKSLRCIQDVLINKIKK